MAKKKKLVACYYFGTESSFEPQYKTVEEVVRERDDLRMRAHQMSKTITDPEVKHIMYYLDKRDISDQIWQAIFYPNMRLLTDEELKQIDHLNAAYCYGFIGAVHI